MTFLTYLYYYQESKDSCYYLVKLNLKGLRCRVPSLAKFPQSPPLRKPKISHQVIITCEYVQLYSGILTLLQFYRHLSCILYVTRTLVVTCLPPNKQYEYTLQLLPQKSSYKEVPPVHNYIAAPRPQSYVSGFLHANMRQMSERCAVPCANFVSQSGRRAICFPRSYVSKPVLSNARMCSVRNGRSGLASVTGHC